MNWNKNIWKLTLILFQWLIQVMRGGAIPMNQRWCISQANERVKIHYDPKNCDKWSPMSRCCCFLFLMQTALFTQQSFLIVKLLIIFLPQVLECLCDVMSQTCSELRQSWECWLHHNMSQSTNDWVWNYFEPKTAWHS